MACLTQDNDGLAPRSKLIMSNGLQGRLSGSRVRIALPEPTSTDAAYNQRAWAPYFHALTSSGAVGVPIPLNAPPATIAKLVGSCSGVLLPGSPADINPQKYGAMSIPECAAPDSAREAADELLLQDAFNLHKPLFGICYGLQALNVWRGGTLIQHLPVVTSVDHDPGPGVLSAHSVRLVRRSKLAGIIGTDHDLVSITERTATVVNSSHHQAVDAAGDGLEVTAHCSEDGVVEALEGSACDHFVLGVQWHPERSFDASAASRHLFRAFVEASIKYRPRAVAESLA
jgi:putative glutamine amidotransferase